MVRRAVLPASRPGRPKIIFGKSRRSKASARRAAAGRRRGVSVQHLARLRRDSDPGRQRMPVRGGGSAHRRLNHPWRGWGRKTNTGPNQFGLARIHHGPRVRVEPVTRSRLAAHNPDTYERTYTRLFAVQNLAGSCCVIQSVAGRDLPEPSRTRPRIGPAGECERTSLCSQIRASL